MERRSKLQKENVSKATLAATAKREAKRARLTAEASSAAAPVDSGTAAAPATATGSSSTDVVTELLGTIALDQPAASEVMALGGNAAQASVVNPPAAAPVDSGTAAAPATASSSTVAPSAVAPAAAGSLPLADDDDEPRDCPGVSRANVVAGENGGQIYARDVVSAPPNQIGGCLPSPIRAGMRPATSVDQYRTDHAGNVRTVWARGWCAPCRAQSPRWGCAVRQVVRWCDGRGGDGGAAAPGERRCRWIGDRCCIGCGIPEPPRLGSCLAHPLGSGLLRLGLMSPFRHLQSANVVDAQMCSEEKLIDQHANATERRGHLGLKRRKSLGRSAVITSGW